MGPNVDAFEREFCEVVGVKHALTLSSGTAAIHLALIHAGVGPGDEVLVSTLTFSASVNPVVYQGAKPVFIDSERASWNMDPDLLAETLARKAKQGRLPKAVILVHLYGQSADIDPVLETCNRYGAPLIEDAALGAMDKGRSPGVFGRAGIFSFDGNKITLPPAAACWSPTTPRSSLTPQTGHPGPGSGAPTTSTPKSATTTA